jgi:hypothetical protein
VLETLTSQPLATSVVAAEEENEDIEEAVPEAES